MTDFIQFGFGLKRRFRRLILVLVLFCSFTASAAVDTSTNWVALSELQKKWDPVPLSEVQKAAEDGDVHAMHYLGHCYGEGLRVSRDPNQSLAWYKRGMQAGYLASANNIGMLFHRRLFGSNGMAQAVYYYTYAAERGDDQSQMNLGVLYRDGSGVPQDFAQARHWFQLAAAQGHANAMVELYQVYWNGNGVSVDHKKAMEWLIKAANTGNVWAEYNLGLRYETREWEGEGAHMAFTLPNWPQAFHWYSVAVEHNSAEAQYHLGMLYIRGKGVEIDEARGLELVRAAADQGVQGALHDLAQCYAFGIGEPRNDADRPIELLRRSKSWDELISRYETGLGTERDLIAAAECYAEASLVLQSWIYKLSDKLEYHPGNRTQSITGIQSFDDREIQIQIPYTDGSDDLRYALSLYLKSAKGDGQAALQIGTRYLKGQDAPQSNARAWSWFTIGAQNGSAEAQANLKLLESHIAPEDLKSGQQEHARQVQQLSRFAAAIAKD